MLPPKLLRDSYCDTFLYIGVTVQLFRFHLIVILLKGTTILVVLHVGWESRCIFCTSIVKCDAVGGWYRKWGMGLKVAGKIQLGVGIWRRQHECTDSFRIYIHSCSGECNYAPAQKRNWKFNLLKKSSGRTTLGDDDQIGRDSLSQLRTICSARNEVFIVCVWTHRDSRVKSHSKFISPPLPLRYTTRFCLEKSFGPGRGVGGLSRAFLFVGLITFANTHLSGAFLSKWDEMGFLNFNRIKREP